MRCREDVIEIEACSYSSKKIAEKIDEIANTDISAYSEKMNELADKWDWEKLRNLYIENFYNLVNNLPVKNYEEQTPDIREAKN